MAMVVNVYFKSNGNFTHGAGIVLEDGKILTNRNTLCKLKISEANWVPSEDEHIIEKMELCKITYHEQADVDAQILEIKRRLESLKKTRKELKNKMSLIKQDVENHLKAKDRKAEIETRIARYKDIDDNEEIDYSFMDGDKSDDKYKILAIIRKSNKPCVYTYGLIARNPRPTTYRKPITKEQAEEYLLSFRMVSARIEKDAIHLNEFSGNDLF